MTKRRAKKKAAAPPPAPEFTRIHMREARAKYGTSLGPAWPGMELELPWEEALVFIDRGWADAC